MISPNIYFVTPESFKLFTTFFTNKSLCKVLLLVIMTNGIIIMTQVLRDWDIILHISEQTVRCLLRSRSQRYLILPSVGKEVVDRQIVVETAAGVGLACLRK